MKLAIPHKLNKKGFAHHLILPVVAVLGVGIIGVITLNLSHAATLYKGTCTGTTYGTANVATYYPCVQDAQELMNAIQHKQNSASGYRTATSHTSGTFAYGTEYYLDMDGQFGTSTSTAVKRLDGSTSLTPTVWQYLCSAAVSNNLGNGLMNFKVSGEPEFYPGTVLSNACESTATTSGTKSTTSGKTSTATPPVVELTVSPTTVPTTGATLTGKDDATLTWGESTDATKCTKSGGWSGAAAIPSGTQTYWYKTAGTYKYTITCTNSANLSDSSSVTVVVK